MLTIAQIAEKLMTEPEVDLGQIPQALWEQWTAACEDAEGLEYHSRVLSRQMGEVQKALRDIRRLMTRGLNPPSKEERDAAGVQLQLTSPDELRTGMLVATLLVPRPVEPE